MSARSILAESYHRSSAERPATEDDPAPGRIALDRLPNITMIAPKTSNTAPQTRFTLRPSER